MFNSSRCASVLNGRSIVPLFESHVPLRLCIEWALPIYNAPHSIFYAILIKVDD
jgi:hypothetical protein